jgi:hypothetical protein
VKPYLRSAGCRTAIASSRSAIDGKTVDGSKSSKPVGKLRESLLNARYDSVGISIVLKNMDGGAIFADVVLRDRSRLLLGRGNERRDDLPKVVKLLGFDLEGPDPVDILSHATARSLLGRPELGQCHCHETAVTGS